MHVYDKVCLGVFISYNMIFEKNERTPQLTFVLLGNIYFLTDFPLNFALLSLIFVVCRGWFTPLTFFN